MFGRGWGRGVEYLQKMGGKNKDTQTFAHNDDTLVLQHRTTIAIDGLIGRT